MLACGAPKRGEAKMSFARIFIIVAMTVFFAAASEAKPCLWHGHLYDNGVLVGDAEKAAGNRSGQTVGSSAKRKGYVGQQQIVSRPPDF
jgi:hypothetical protein